MTGSSLRPMRMVLEIIQGASHFVSGSSAVLAGEIALSQIHENAALKRTGIAGRDVGSLSWLHPHHQSAVGALGVALFKW